MHVGQDDELVVPLENTQRTGSVRERWPVWHRGSEGCVEIDVRFKTKALRDATVHLGEQFRIAQARRRVLVSVLKLREGAERGLAGHIRSPVVHDQRL